MTIQLLIDAIVRQTTVLIAQLATSGGIRAPLSHIANQVFLALANELEAQGVSRKVGHPLRDEVLGSLKRFRDALGELRARVDEHNERHGVPPSYDLVVVYGGQSVTKEDGEENHDAAT